MVYLFQEDDANTVVVTASKRNQRPWVKANVLFEGTLAEFRAKWGNDLKDDKVSFINCIYKLVWTTCDHVARP